MNRARRNVQPVGGFTLIELMLATALIAMIMAMAYGGFRAGVRATTSGGELIEETNRLRVVHQFVRRQIGQAKPLIIEESDESQIRFEGERDRIRFVAPMPGYLSFGGPYVQELRLERGQRGMDLVFAFAMLNGYEPGDLEVQAPITLLEDVGDIAFEFLGFDEDGEEVFWDTQWQDPSRVPLAVTLSMDLESGNRVSWPTLATPVIQDSGASRQLQQTIGPGTRASDLMLRDRSIQR
ncbi:MAG: prepilin-type N-terminal cleavage/methylation domain-containing protein [Wenzhouxiangellaceae bacterium]|nr:prepilin-type N-terminal cleavage/methylation domain-containing protein [Wenzhouxiangellaceae bacterium]